MPRLPSPPRSDEAVRLEQLLSALDTGNLELQMRLCRKLNWDPRKMAQAGVCQSEDTDDDAESLDKSDRLSQLIGTFGPNCLSCKDVDGNTLVHLTAKSCADATAMQLIYNTVGQECFWRQRGWNRRTAFHCAAQNPCSSALKWLVKLMGPKYLRAQDATGSLPVHLSAWHQGADSMELYKSELGASCFHLRDDEQLTAFHYAAMNFENDDQALRWLVDDIGPDLLVTRGYEGRTCVHLAAWIQCADTMEMLKDKLGSDLIFTLMADCGETVVHSAALNPLTNSTLNWCVTELGADCLLTKDSLNRTPIHLAAQYQSRTSIELAVNLLGLSCLTVPDNEQRTAVHYAAMNDLSNSALRWIVSRLGPDCLAQPDADGNMPIHLAAQYQGVNSLILIKDSLGASAFKLAGQGKQTIAHVAAEGDKKKEMIEWIVSEIGPQCLLVPNARNRTPAHIYWLQ